jgi:gamma-glutamylcysteine synthetase
MIMEKKDITQLLYKKYISPTTNNRKKYAGIEIEMPVVNLDKKPVEKQLMLSLIISFAKEFDFTVNGKDDNGDVYSVENKQNGDIYTFDCSYNNIELSFGKADDINEIWCRFKKYVDFTNGYLKPYNTLITGFGENPYRHYNNNVPIPNGRYRMLFHYLNSYKKYQPEKHFHNYPEFGTYSSASQVQIDVDFKDIPQTLNVFNKLEPLKALLFSNSVLNGDNEDFICARDMLWEHSMQGYNKHNLGMYNVNFSNNDDVIKYLNTTSIYCTQRDGKYLNFTPIMVSEYFNRDYIKGEYYENGSYHTMTFKPENSDIDYLRTFKFTDLTFRGTIEHRSCCTQPLKDAMCVSAFHTGITNRLNDVEELLRNDNVIYNSGYTSTELRKLFVKKTLPECFNKNEIKKLLCKLIDIAYDGLKVRGKGEEKFIDCLYKRAENLETPAQYYLNSRAKGKSDECIIKEFAEI